MATKAEELRQLAQTIKNETEVGGNTAERVGSAFEGVADALDGTQATQELEQVVAQVQQEAEEAVAKVQQLVDNLPVVQQTGDSTTSVMSQKAVTDELKTLQNSIDASGGDTDAEHLVTLTTDSDLVSGYISSQGSLISSAYSKSLYKYDISNYDKILVFDGVGNAAYTIIYDANDNVLMSTNTKKLFRIIDVKNIGAAKISATWGQINTFAKGESSLEGELTNGVMGDDGSFIHKYLSSYTTPLIPCKKGDKYLYVGAATSQAKGYVSFDEEANIIDIKNTSCAKPLYIEIGDNEKFIRFSSAVNDAKFIKVTRVDGIEEIKGKWLSLGTSRTWYNEAYTFVGSLGLPPFWQGYQSCLMEKMQFTSFVNNGVNGGGLTSALTKVEAADYITIEHGVNDNNTNYGTIEDFKNGADNGTFAANFRKLTDAIYAANPYAKIIIITPTHYTDTGYLEEIAKLEREICAEMSFPCVDCYSESGVNPSNASLYAIDSGLHPNQAGYRLIANLLYDAFHKVAADFQYSMSFKVTDTTGTALDGINVTLTNKYTKDVTEFTSTSDTVIGVKLLHGEYTVSADGYSDTEVKVLAPNTITIQLTKA